ncbi:YihY/virulence factor BrkB family protein [Mycobacterium yunnanensis]|uniref:YihY/virulence factor BrkB family protein n=1 Tax=Mycobacterium yunnanensis TaxID=368477 RepID=A0A9X2YJL5_9MYCO|nr:YihY/virulence factor BrkB family protein [Mycobacterium yunnanensis]MCV7420568.1 YihY/virulence factor BrkB family protein [Mycobacterium yunnanensis]
MGITARLDRLQRRHRGVGFSLAVVYKYLDDQGGYLAALITYYAFVSLFPLLLLLSTVLSWVLVGHPAVQQQVMTSALSQFPVIGSQLGEPKHLGGGVTGVVVGVAGALYGGLGVGQALQNAMNTVWAVPRDQRPDPFTARARSLLLLVTVGGALAATTVLAGITAGSGAFGAVTKACVMAVSVAVNAGAFIMAFRISTDRDLAVGQVAPGAVTAAVGWQLVQSFGATYVGHVVKSASATNGVFALVLGMLAFLYATATMVVLCAEINVVRVDRLHPRALLTPFVDDVNLTAADRQIYTDQATAQRSKPFQHVEVTFDAPTRDSDRGGHPDPETGDALDASAR